MSKCTSQGFKKACATRLAEAEAYVRKIMKNGDSGGIRTCNLPLRRGRVYYTTYLNIVIIFIKTLSCVTKCVNILIFVMVFVILLMS